MKKEYRIAVAGTGYVGLSIAKAVSTYDGAEIFEEISEKGA